MRTYDLRGFVSDRLLKLRQPWPTTIQQSLTSKLAMKENKN